METYIALLRGINVGGKNKVSMPKLREAMGTSGFTDVQTYINSGNVLFSGRDSKTQSIAEEIKNIILETFSLEIPVIVVTTTELSDALEHAPSWWGVDDKSIYHNAIFVIEPYTVENIIEIVGDVKAEIEKIAVHNMVIFWSANKERFSQTRWSKLASSKANSLVTVRNVNTTKKLLDLAKKRTV